MFGEPVKGAAGAVGGVDRGGADDDETVGQVEGAVHRGVHQAGPAVGDQHVVEPGDQACDRLVLALVEHLGLRRVHLGGKHGQTPGEAEEPVELGPSLDGVTLVEEVADRRPPSLHIHAEQSVGEGAGIGVGVERHDTIAAVLGEGQSEKGRDGRLPDAALHRGDGDRGGPGDVDVSGTDPLPALHLVLADPGRDQPEARLVDDSPPSVLRDLSRRPDKAVV